MNKIFSAVLFISILSGSVLANMEKANFFKELASDQSSGMIFKRMTALFFGQAPPNSVQCAFACMKDDNCTSVYMDGQDCVFGFNNVTAFEEGELVTPDPRQVLKMKGKKLLG